MVIQQEKEPNTIQSLMAKSAFLESSLAEKDSVITKLTTVYFNPKVYQCFNPKVYHFN